MKEYLTEAIVLGIKPQGEYDKFVDLYTKDLGRVEARVVSGRKILSKLSPHLNLGSRVLARLVQKNQFTLTDVLNQSLFLSKNLLLARLKILEILYLLRTLIPVLVPDLNMWHRLLQELSKGETNLSLRIFLKILGYDPMFASCDGCGSNNICGFFITEQVFVCRKCIGKLPARDVVML